MTSVKIKKNNTAMVPSSIPKNLRSAKDDPNRWPITSNFDGKGANNSDIDSDRAAFLMFSLESFAVGKDGRQIPSGASLWCTCAVLVAMLFAAETSLRYFFAAIKDVHPVLDDATNRNILARYIGANTLATLACAILGLSAWHVVREMFHSILGGRERKNAIIMPIAHEGRMFTYHPEAQRICLCFLAYQLKNTYDALVWNDGFVYALHHILSVYVAQGTLRSNNHFYAVFFFGVSELSSVPLNLVCCFDNEVGVTRLADAYPTVHAVLSAIFVVLFVVLRVFMWMVATYSCGRNVLMALLRRSKKDTRLERERTWWSSSGSLDCSMLHTTNNRLTRGHLSNL